MDETNNSNLSNFKKGLIIAWLVLGAIVTLGSFAMAAVSLGMLISGGLALFAADAIFCTFVISLLVSLFSCTAVVAAVSGKFNNDRHVQNEKNIKNSPNVVVKQTFEGQDKGNTTFRDKVEPKHQLAQETNISNSSSAAISAS